MRSWNWVSSVLIFLAAAALSGCGTFINMRECPPKEAFFDDCYWPAKDIPTQRIFGGVRTDLDCCGQIVTHRYGAPLAWLVGLLIDMPLSVAGDTLTLPFTTFATIERLCGVPRGYPDGHNPATSAMEIRTTIPSDPPPAPGQQSAEPQK